MKKTTVILLAALVGMAAGIVQAEDIAGKWCVQGNPKDCLVINPSPHSPDAVVARFQEGETAYAEGTGYFRDGKLVLAFRRLNARDIGYATFHLRDKKTADGRTFNPDGTLRWKGLYLK